MGIIKEQLEKAWRALINKALQAFVCFEIPDLIPKINTYFIHYVINLNKTIRSGLKKCGFEEGTVLGKDSKEDLGSSRKKENAIVYKRDFFGIIKGKRINENCLHEVAELVIKREAATDRRMRIDEEIKKLQKEDAGIITYLSNIDEKLEAFGSIRYTEDFLDALIEEETLRSKKGNLIRLKDEVIKGTSGVETVLAIIDQDTELRDFIYKQHEGTFVAKMFRNISNMGEG
ncbi:hypothetical protein [Lysinibacillus xylanilyticus]|uniref:hypothetical protein n=1 Tax=Lysinibacillus xylanilyticus TaxID=582475 RepID=UPI003CFEE27F